MHERLPELERIVREAVRAIPGIGRVASVTVEPDQDDRDRICVVVEVAKSRERLPQDILLSIVNAASDAIQETGEDRFPLVFGRFAATQEFAAA